MDIGSFQPSLTTWQGRRGFLVTPSDEEDIPGGPVKAVMTMADGDLSVIPVDNADDQPIAFTDRAAEFVPPFIVRRVMATGTNVPVIAITY